MFFVSFFIVKIGSMGFYIRPAARRAANAQVPEIAGRHKRKLPDENVASASKGRG
jgi:hypothetical protein